MIARLARAVLERLTSCLPAKTFLGANGSPYLSRFTLLDLGAERGRLYLHRFHRGDQDQDLHSHPWRWGRGLVLVGGYREERRFRVADLADRWATSKEAVEDGWVGLTSWSAMAEAARATGSVVLSRVLRPGSLTYLRADTFHRVDLIDGEAWTLFAVGPVEESWGFWDRATGAVVPWREHHTMRGIEVTR